MFKKKPKYKNRAPEDTIHLIRTILRDAGIFISENSVYHSASKTAASSVRFGDEAFYKSGYITNGKGMNARFSLASGYAEMMERLQSGCLIRGDRKRAYKEELVKYYISSDEIIVKLEDLGKEGRMCIKTLLHLTDNDFDKFTDTYGKKEIFCLPYLDVSSQKKVLLPFDLFFVLFTSNGLCAGNTYHEAFSQGLSELFERAVLAEIYGDNPALARLSDSDFEGSEVIDKLRFLKSQGYEYTIIDASLSKSYPVVGLKLEYGDGIMTDLGADPNPIVALERCLTELFQCVEEGKHLLRLSQTNCGLRSDWTLETQKEWYYSQFMRAKTLDSGAKPDNLVHIPEIYSESYTYNEELSEDYDYYLNLLNKLGYHAYVRDFSYLGFPTYQVLVPELSLGDYNTEFAKKRLELYLEEKFGPQSSAEETYQAVIPILKYLEKKQRDYYKNSDSIFSG